MVTQKNNGFTLLEMVLSIGIFSVVVITAISIMISVTNAQQKASNIQAVQDNIRFSLELIAKELRTGAHYQIVPSLCAPLGYEIHFDATSGRRIYFWDSTNLRIMRAKEEINAVDCDGSTGKTIPFTANDVYVDRFAVQTTGIAPGWLDGQPRVMITLRVRSKNPKIQLESSMDLQTTVVQRTRDLTP